MGKKRPKNAYALPENATGEERMLALFHRLYPGHRRWRASPAVKTAIFRALILEQPEFSSGRGRKSGSKNKKIKKSGLESLDRTNKNTRTYRDRKRRTVIGRDGEVFLLEPSVSLKPSWKR